MTIFWVILTITGLFWLHTRINKGMRYLLRVCENMNALLGKIKALEKICYEKPPGPETRPK